MKSALSVLLLLYVVALHTSIAAMEILSWLIFVLIVGWKIKQRTRFDFPLAIPLAGLILTVGISLLVNPALKEFWFQFGFMRWVFLLWSFSWALREVWNAQFEERFVKVWMGAFTLACAYAVFQCLTGIDPLHSRQVVFPQDGLLYKATGFFSFSLTYAYSIGISLFVIAVPMWRRNRALGVAAWVTGSLGLLASMSKGAWLAALAAVFIYLLMEKRKLVPLFIAAVVAAGAALMAFSPVFQEKIGRIIHLSADRSAMTRLDLWQAYWSMFLDHPFFGVGIFQGDKLLPEYYQRLGVDQEFVSHAHNILLQWAVGAGVLSLGFYLWISGAFLKMAWGIRQFRVWGWALFLAQLYWQLGSLTEANFIDGEVNHMITFTWAAVLCVSAMGRRANVGSTDGDGIEGQNA